MALDGKFIQAKKGITLYGLWSGAQICTNLYTMVHIYYVYICIAFLKISVYVM